MGAGRDKLTDDELRAIVITRLRADAEAAERAGINTTTDDEFRTWLAAQPPASLTSPEDAAVLEYWTAKAQARAGDLEPLRKIMAARMGDPDIANFIARPAQPKHVRRDYATKPLEKEWRSVKADTIRRIREIIVEEERETRGIEERVVEIAANILDCSRPQVREIIRHGPPKNPRKRSAPKRR